MPNNGMKKQARTGFQDMTKLVEWIEPFGNGKYGYTCTAVPGEVIKYMKEEYQEQFKDHPNYPYKTDQAALDDFIIINWATLIDVS